MVGRRSPVRFYFLLAIFLGILGTVGLFWGLGAKNTIPVWLTSWLVSINVIAFGYYGFDKARSRGVQGRIPEMVLHGLSVLGGSPGAYLGMNFFRHKTIKGRFRILFWCIVVVQALLVVWLVKVVWFSAA